MKAKRLASVLLCITLLCMVNPAAVLAEDVTPPEAPLINTPVNGSVKTVNTPQLDGTAEPGSTVRVYVDEEEIGYVTAAAGVGFWAVTPPDALSDGSHTVYATATDAAGNTSQQSIAKTFTVDTTPPPAPVLISPADGSLQGKLLPFSGTAEPNCVIRIYVDGSYINGISSDDSGKWNILVNTVTDGSHTAYVTASDMHSLTGPNSAVISFTMDAIPPSAPSISYPGNGSTINENTPTVLGTAESNSTVYVYVDGNDPVTAAADSSGNWSYTVAGPLTDARHYLSATCRDTAGNNSSISGLITYTVDAVEEAVILSPGSNSVTADSTLVYSGTAIPGNYILIFVDGYSTGFTIADGSGNWSYTASTPLSEGPHTVMAMTTEPSGTVTGGSKTTTFTVDTTPPAAPQFSFPADNSFINDNTPTILGSAEANSTVTVYVDGSLSGTATVDSSGNWSHTVAGALAAGSHTASATAKDTAGNTSPDSGTVSFTVDTAAPAAPVVTAPADGSSTNNNRPNVAGTAENNSTVTVYVDGGARGTTTAGASGIWSFMVPAVLTDGSHTVKAAATDAAGNTGADSGMNTFTVDATPPNVPEVLAPGDGGSIMYSTFSYNGRADAGCTVIIEVDGAEIGTVTVGGSDGLWTITQPSPLGDGTHTVLAKARDALDNESAYSDTNTFTVDTIPPGIPAVLSPADLSSINDNTPAFSGTAEAGCLVTVNVDGSTFGNTRADSLGVWSLEKPNALTEGAHTVMASASDDGGNNSGFSDANDFTVDTLAPAVPEIYVPANGGGVNHSTFSYNGRADAGSIVTIEVDGASIGDVTAESTGAWIIAQPVPLADGTYTVRAKAHDAAGNTSAYSAANIFTVDTVTPGAPVMLTPADGSSTNDTTPVFTGTAEAGCVVTVNVDGSTYGNTKADSSGNWSLEKTLILATGVHTVKSSATDAGGNSSGFSGTNTFTVDVTAPAEPVLNQPANSSRTGDNTPACSGTAEALSTITVYVDGSSAGTAAADGSGSWTFIPSTPLNDGFHSVYASASDAAGNISGQSGTNTFTVDATPPNAPVINTPANLSCISSNAPSCGNVINLICK